MRIKPDKPSPDFPLFAHQSGQWAKKIGGKLKYFGVWEKPSAAEAKYRELYPDPQAATPADGTLRGLLDAFCDYKERRVKTGELTPKAYSDYEAVCKTIAKTIGKARRIDSIEFEDLDKLRTVLALDSTGNKRSPASLRRLLTTARMVFKFGNEEYGYAVKFRRALEPPTAKSIREAANKQQPRVFTAAELRDLVERARPNLKAMILMGINCGFGNTDCGMLTIDKLDLESGWHNFPRPKTAVQRRCPLWPETIAALRKVVGERTEGWAFVTKYGNPWSGAAEGKKPGKSPRNPLVLEFRKLMGDNYREDVTTFYSLRRTFETIATDSQVPQAVIDSIMGHVPHNNDMGARYRQGISNASLRKCVNHVRKWYLGEIEITLKND